MSEQRKFGLFVVALVGVGAASVTFPIADYILALAPAIAFSSVVAAIIYAFVDAIAGHCQRYRT